MSHRRAVTLLAGSLCCSLTPVSGQVFVNWETPHVTPSGLTPDGSTLLVVNTPDNRIEVYDISSGSAVHTDSIPVGLDPVTVRARTNTEAWVVNHISDSISVVDLTAGTVIATIDTGDEPTDVVFTNTGQERAFVSVSQLNQVRVFDPTDLSAAPTIIPIEGEDPRAMVTDGQRVLVNIFESGNNTTILHEEVVSSSVNPYPGDENPPPNVGNAFMPPINPAMTTTPPAVSLIVKKDANGDWRDDNDGNWSNAVTWDLHDHDVAIIDAGTLSVSYATGLMNLNMAIGLRAGEATVVGSEAINHIRFEPVIAGTFIRMHMASFDPVSPASKTIVDLNPHLDYTQAMVDQPTRDLSVGDPRSIVWNAAGTRGYVAGMGSNNVIVIDELGGRIAEIEVGEGPTGLSLDEARSRLYVLNKFDGSISVVDTGTDLVIGTVRFHDPTPDSIRDGRPHLYDTHRTSGLGQSSCASCHIDGRMDQLAWDLGDPTGTVKTFNQICNGGLPIVGDLCEDWNPMKGPMTTQTLIGIIGTGPLHWRADREDLAAFNVAFEGLLADDTDLTTQEMNEFVDFIANTTTGPNPYRNIDNSLPTSIPPVVGNPANGSVVFDTALSDGGALTCVSCHARPSGTNGTLTSANALQETQSIKIPQLRNMHEKTGFDQSSQSNNRGYGFIHDGSIDTLFNFLGSSVFTLSTQQRRDLEAFMFCFATDTHAGIGTQTTVLDGSSVPGAQQALLDEMVSLSTAGGIALVAKGVVNGEARGYAYRQFGLFQSDRDGETFTPAALQALATPAGGEITYTLVPFGSENRIGIDRDLDGFLDRDELDVCSDPADASDFPGSPLSVDQSGNGVVDIVDLLGFLSDWFGGMADLNLDGITDVLDLLGYLAIWFECSA